MDEKRIDFTASKKSVMTGKKQPKPALSTAELIAKYNAKKNIKIARTLWTFVYKRNPYKTEAERLKYLDELEQKPKYVGIKKIYLDFEAHCKEENDKEVEIIKELKIGDILLDDDCKKWKVISLDPPEVLKGKTTEFMEWDESGGYWITKPDEDSKFKDPVTFEYMIKK